MYRVGWPAWRLAARCGAPMLLRVDVAQDKDAGVLIATSPDLQGLVVEASSTEELMREVFHCVDMLMEEELKQPPKHRPRAAWNGDFLPA